MNEKEFLKQFQGSFRKLRKQRNPCPTTDQLTAFSLGELGAAEEAILEAHLGTCPHCEELVRRLKSTDENVDESEWRKIECDLDRQPSPWRQAHRFGLRGSPWKSLGAVAASLVLVAVSGWWISSQMRTSRQTPASTLRGSLLQIRNPSGRVERIESFRWDAPPLEVVYRLEIRQGERPVWEVTTGETRYRPPEGLRTLLKKNVPYRWRVEGIDNNGDSVAQSAWIVFSLQP